MGMDTEASGSAEGRPLALFASAGMESRAEGRLTGWSALDWAATVFLHRRLLAALVKRDMELRFRGSALGLLWILVSPIVLAGLYTYASGVMGSRLADGTAGAALSVYLATIVFQLFTEPVVKASSVIQDQSVFIKKVAIPVRILPVVAVASTAATCSISLATLLLAALALVGAPTTAWLVAPPALALLVVASCGAAWAVSALAAYVRDVRHLAAFAVTALLFTTPVFYPLSSVPTALRPFVLLNPATYCIETLRGALLSDRPPEAVGFCLYAIGCMSLCVFGYAAFRRLQGGFADVV